MAVAIIVVAFTRYSGSALVFVLFNACFIGLVAAAIPRPRAYVYTVLAAFLALGLWAKTMVHTIWAAKFVEPVGGFGHSPAEWDQALIAMSAAALGVLLARGLHIVALRRFSHGAASTAPSWFVKYRGTLWIATIIAILAVNAANLPFAYYQIGVSTKGLLPLRLHVLLAWLVNIGFALWIAALVWWDYLARPGSLARSIGVAFLEAVVSSVSAFSRILFLIHSAPYGLALWEERKRFAAAIRRRHGALLAATFIVLFLVSVFAVFALRANYYPSNADLGRNIKLEVPQLVVQRWIGLEGVLSVGALPDRSPRLLLQALAESPKAGMDSLYQRAAQTRYRVDDKRSFIFLTNAGPVAVLLFSGSLAIVALGMAALTLVLLATEEAAARWTGNPFLLAVSGAALANVVSQTTFFYLTVIFLLQMWLAFAVIGALPRIGR